MDVESTLRNARILTTPFGRRRMFFGRWGPDLVREAYAYIPQSTVSDLINQGIIRAWPALPQGWEIMMQVHDSVMLQIPKETDPMHISKFVHHYFENPLGPTLYDDSNKSFELFSNNYLEIKIPGIEGLKYKLNTGVDLLTTNHSSYEGQNTTNGYEANGIARADGVRKTNVVIENLLTYQKTFGDHGLDLTGLYSFQETVLNRDRLTGRGFDSDILSWYQMDLAELTTPEQDYWKTDLLSWMGRINYNYNKKYYATFTVRSDGFSGFGEDTKWGTFPSLALAWNIKNENFLASSDFVNQLKLRLSYGINGNQAVGPYQTISRMGTENEDNRGSGRDYAYINGTTFLPGFIPTVLGTPGLGWEETTSVNVGLDFLFSSFYIITCDYSKQ